jgi:hypothetical protein
LGPAGQIISPFPPLSIESGKEWSFSHTISHEQLVEGEIHRGRRSSSKHHAEIHAWSAFAVPPNVSSVTPIYSWRMLQNFRPHDNFMGDVRSVSEL